MEDRRSGRSCLGVGGAAMPGKATPPNGLCWTSGDSVLCASVMLRFCISGRALPLGSPLGGAIGGATFCGCD